MYGTNYDKNRGLDNQDFPVWVAEKIKKTFYNFSDPLFSNERIIISNKGGLEERYKGKDIFIFGGGGSSLRFLDSLEYGKIWALSDKDRSLWTLNNFYKNERFRKVKFDLVSLGPEVDLQDTILIDYLNRKMPDVGIELHQKWSRESVDSPIVQQVNDFYPVGIQEKFCFQTKYFSFLGSGARLVLLASELGARSVTFIGFDGPDAIWKADHAFEEGKNFMTYRMQGFSQQVAREMFQSEYDWFWEYCNKTYQTLYFSADNQNNYHQYLRRLYG